MDYEEKIAYIVSPGQGHVPVHWDSVGQFTGLHDKNGKEIYEGDVINDSFGNRKGIIRYNVHTASFEISVYDGIHLLTSGNSKKFFEVIGNIYENPELLEVDK